jgi:hypothetical protein
MEALARHVRTAVDNRWTTLVILLLGAPHVLEGAEGSKNGTANPDRIFAFGSSDNLDLRPEVVSDPEIKQEMVPSSKH